jgi:hypothetical protein
MMVAVAVVLLWRGIPSDHRWVGWYVGGAVGRVGRWVSGSVGGWVGGWRGCESGRRHRGAGVRVR